MDLKVSDEECEVSKSLIMKCEQPFTCGDVFDGYIGQEHSNGTCPPHHHCHSSVHV